MHSGRLVLALCTLVEVHKQTCHTRAALEIANASCGADSCAAAGGTPRLYC